MSTNNATNEQKLERTLTGTVVSTSMKDTVVVLITRYRKHPKYRKYLTRSKRLKAHDKGNACTLGDTVLIRETRPISKGKHHMVIERLKVKEQGDVLGIESSPVQSE